MVSPDLSIKLVTPHHDPHDLDDSTSDRSYLPPFSPYHPPSPQADGKLKIKIQLPETIGLVCVL